MAYIFLEFFLIFILQLLGVGFHVMQKIIAFGNTHPEKTKREIIAIFWKEDWDTLGVSALVLIVDIVMHLIITVYAPHMKELTLTIPLGSLITWLPDIVISYLIGSFLLAFFLGYAGQRLFYKILGSTEKKITEKFD